MSSDVWFPALMALAGVAVSGVLGFVQAARQYRRSVFEARADWTRQTVIALQDAVHELYDLTGEFTSSHFQLLYHGRGDVGGAMGEVIRATGHTEKMRARVDDEELRAAAGLVIDSAKSHMMKLMREQYQVETPEGEVPRPEIDEVIKQFDQRVRSILRSVAV